MLVCQNTDAARHRASPPAMLAVTLSSLSLFHLLCLVFPGVTGPAHEGGTFLSPLKEWVELIQEFVLPCLLRSLS